MQRLVSPVEASRSCAGLLNRGAMTFSSLGRKSQEFVVFLRSMRSAAVRPIACCGDRASPDHNLGLASQALTFRAARTNRLNSKLSIEGKTCS